MSLKAQIIAECSRQGLLRNQTAYVLATGDWETNHTFEPVREAYWVKNAEAWRKANLRYYPYYGRGLVQLTWEKNYALASDKLGLPMLLSNPPKPMLVGNPDLALEPDNAVKIIVTGMKEGWFTGKKLSDYITLRTSNFTGARKIINGTDKASEIAELAKNYDAELKASGYGQANAKPIIPPPPPDAPIPGTPFPIQPDDPGTDTPVRPQPKSHTGVWVLGLIVVVALVAIAIFTPIFKG